MLGGDGGAFDQRQKIALHALAGDIAAAAVFRARADLVDLVQEHDAIVLHRLDRFAQDRVIVDELVGFFFDQRAMRLFDGEPARARLAAERLAENVAKIDHADLGVRHAGNFERRGPAGIAHFELDVLVVEFAIAQVSDGRIRAWPGSH